MNDPPNSPFRNLLDLESLVSSFESGALPRSEWNHRAHLTVALWYLLQHGPDRGPEAIRAGIQRYNRAHGIEVTPTGGYHETLTGFWIRIVSSHIERSAPDADVLALSNGLAPLWSRKDLPFEHYTRERLFSAEARAGWVEPDLREL